MSTEFLSSNQLVKRKNYSELFLIFTLLEKTYAIPAEKVVEIVQLPALTIVEKFPDYMVGLLNLRGQIISVIDPGKLLGIEQKTYTTDHQILIVNCNDQTIGVVVHSVNDVVQLDRNRLEPLPYKPKEKIISGIYKHEDKLIAFFDIGAVLDHVAKFQDQLSEIKDAPDVINNFFPSDENSRIKFLKRAEKLQKEIRSLTEGLNYQENYFISFCLNNETYCINLKYVKEITKLKLVNLAPVPCVPEFILGVINLRGEFITLVDIKHFLSISKSSLSDRTKIIVLKIFDIQLGILVDDVFDIENIPNEKMNLSVQTKYEKNKYTSAEVLLPNKQVMSVFDIKKFIEDERLFIEDSI
ncbi:MAG TPA: chemotaxis protein CheW [Candidatus Gastranaerophilales bacterium]|nr:chemotaxis protein CheW [Candidatus Gastranaerophilales bacterium]